MSPTDISVMAALARDMGPLIGGVLFTLWLVFRENAKNRTYQRQILEMFSAQGTRVEATLAETRAHAINHAARDASDHETIRDGLREVRETLERKAS